MEDSLFCWFSPKSFSVCRRRCWWRQRRPGWLHCSCEDTGRCRPRPSTSLWWKIFECLLWAGGSQHYLSCSPWTGDTGQWWCLTRSAGTSVHSWLRRGHSGLYTHLIEADWHEVNVRGPHRLVSFIPILAEELTRWNFTMGGIIQSTYWLLMENNICWSKKVISSAISSALKLERLSVEGNWNDHDHRIETVSFVPQEASESHWDWFCFFHFSSPPRGAARRSYVPLVSVWTSRQFPPGNLQPNFLILSHQSPDRAWWSSDAKHSKPSCWRRSLTGIFSALLPEWRFCVLCCVVLLHQFTIWSWRSRGLLEPAIATAKARAAVLELDLQRSNIDLNVNMWRDSPHLLPACLLEVTTTPILVKLLGLEDSGDFPLLRPLVPLSVSQSPEEEWRVENAFFFFLPNFPNVLDEALVKGGVNVILVLGWHWMCWASSSQEW